MGHTKHLEDKIEKVLNILNLYDPYGIAVTCGKEEYDIEAVEIANRSSVMNIETLSQWCHDVFAFWLYDIPNYEMWNAIAKDIKNS